MKKIFQNRFSLLFSFLLFYIVFSQIVRISLYVLSVSNIDFSLLSIAKILGLGFVFDFSVALFFGLVYSIYLLVIPSKLIGSKLDKICTNFFLSLLLFICFFAFFSEFPFWDEFNTRFNFIAVDYLIYTFEVVENINQSYPIPLIILTLILCILLVIYFFKKKDVFQNTFQSKTPFRFRFLVLFPYFLLTFSLAYFLKNQMAEWSSNSYENELSKNGVFSFFAAFRSNELDYQTFYANLEEKERYQILKKELLQNGEVYTTNEYDNIERQIEGTNSEKPNIILICIESFSAEFLERFGNQEKLTPNMDKLAKESLFFTNLYATGTRTVRGMEALTLCMPPTPGNSIVRRPNNNNLYSIATILKQKNYKLNFIYGGDGYFDNMNTFFGGQGFDIIDRDRGNPLSDDIKTNRFSIPDNEVTFENAWGICDQDIYNQAIKYADKYAKTNQPFFHFIMTTSNHKPYSFPEKTINAPQGSRESAVKYTDYALGKFIEESKTKPWFKNTVFIIVADHCASSAGKWEINIEKHHIPALIYNLNNQKGEISNLASQIDVTPTLFGLLNWNYKSALFGKDVTKMKANEERALIGNYRTLGLLKGTVFTEINDRKKVNQYNWNSNNKTLNKIAKPIDSLKKLTISYYQTASERFKNGKMKE